MAFALQNQPKPGRQSFALLSFARGPGFCKICYALLPHMACIVLADFGRSWFADGKK
jgi:hypothetical protein